MRLPCDERARERHVAGAIHVDRRFGEGRNERADGRPENSGRAPFRSGDRQASEGEARQHIPAEERCQFERMFARGSELLDEAFEQREYARLHRNEPSAAERSVAHPGPRVRHFRKAALVDGFLDAAVDEIRGERPGAANEILRRDRRKHGQVGCRDEYVFVGRQSGETAAQALADMDAVGPKVVGEGKIAVILHAGRRHDDQASHARSVVEGRKDAADQRHAFDLDEGFVWRARLEARNLIERAAGEDYCIHCGVAAKRVARRS